MPEGTVCLLGPARASRPSATVTCRLIYLPLEQAVSKKPPRTGAVAANLRGGAISEYLAQYICSTFGTSVLVPRQEDYGVDLYCTLFAKRTGKTVLPESYYSVQVKSRKEARSF